MGARPSHSLHPALALGAGLALHGVVLAFAARLGSPELGSPGTRSAEIEVSLLPAEVARDAPARAGEPQPGGVKLAHATARAATTRRKKGEPAAGSPPPPDLGEILDSPEGSQAPIPSAPRRAVDLGLTGSLTRALLLDGRAADRAPRRPSAGRLAEELDARDAARGYGRAGVVVSAAERASMLDAPAFGTALFEVRADATGRVATVTLVRFGSDGRRWHRVAQGLRAALARRRLRLPKGARGFACLLRIERGALAQDTGARGRTKRSAAVGQGSLGPKDLRDESTQARLTPGRASPTLGTTVAGGGGGTPTRVVLLRQRAL